jgi:hypothetical protein
MAEPGSKTYRRVVAGHKGANAVVLSDTTLSTYKFNSVPGFEQTYVWTITGAATGEADVTSVARRATAARPI